MQNTTLTKNLPNKQPRVPKNLPNDIKEISEQIISDQQIIQQFAPKILHAVLNNQLEQIFQEPKDQKIIDLTESKITEPQNVYFNNQVQLFSPNELKNAIYRYNENITKISDLTKKNGNIDLLDQITNILHITARNPNSDSDSD